jgi:hypothetical protein
MQAAPYLLRYAIDGPNEQVETAERLHWLSPGEHEVLARLADSRRRAAFLRGRILSKRLILVEFRAALRLGTAVIHPAQIEIDSGLARQKHEGPRITIAGRQLPWSLSIAHSERGVLVALGRTPAVQVGVDLAEPVALSRGFADVWFTPAERRLVGGGPADLAVTLWAIKEAVYKAVGDAWPFTPRAIEVLPREPGRFVSRPACSLAVWRTPQGETAVVAHRFNHRV